MTWRARIAAVGVAALVVAGSGIGFAGAASADSSPTPLFTATTHITNDPDSGGGGGFWAVDGPGSDYFTRVLAVYNADTTVCTHAGLTLSAGDICYAATITDSGPFKTILNAKQPNQTLTPTGNTITHVVDGTFTGSSGYVFYSNEAPSETNVPAFLDNSAHNSITPTWWAQAVPSVAHQGGVELNDWSWTYDTGCETWTDSYANHDGQSTPVTDDGNITGTVCPPPAPADAVSVTNPGDQSSSVNVPASLQILASSSQGHVTGYSASGLPAGLSVNASTGLISGTPTAVGTSSVTVSATDNLGKSDSQSFSWRVTGLTAPPPPSSARGDEVNHYGNGFDVFRQHFAAGAIIAGWPATQHDPATDFARVAEGSAYRFEALNGGAHTGLCVSDPAGGWSWADHLRDGLILTPCNTGAWQKFVPQSNGTLKNAATGLVVNPDGTGAQLRGGSSPTSWGGSSYTWKDHGSLPA